jgi:serralysin
MTTSDTDSFACACNATSDGAEAGTLVTATSGSAKPVYDAQQVIHALTTHDGATPSLAWKPDIITYSIGTGAVDATHAEYTSEMDGYVAMTAAMEAAARTAFELWDDLIAVELLEMDDWPSAQMTFNYSSNTGGETYTNFGYWLVDNAPRSDYKLADADIWMADDWSTHDEDSDLFQGGFGILTYLHEIGHALGITHPGDYNGTASYDLDATHQQDTRQYTVMSYFQAGEDGLGTDHVGSSGWSFGATPLLHDILSAQAVYGADMTTRIGDTVYGFNSTAARDAFDFTVNLNPVVAIWDAGGIDRIDASGWNTNQVIDLNPGAFSSVGEMTRNLAIAYGATIEQAAGGGGNDLILGNSAENLLAGNAGSDNLQGAAGNDTLQGGDGNDILQGGSGDDRLEGGDGADILIGGPGADRIDGGAGEDWVRYTTAAAGVVMSLATGAGASGEAVGDIFISIENVTGSAFGDSLTGSNLDNKIEGGGGNDTILGLSGHDFLLGGDGDDTIDGGNGNDILRGGPGADVLIGGVGTDWAQYNAAIAGVALSLATGGTGGEAAGDSFSSIENVRGSDFADSLTGDAVRNLIMGGAGDDFIDGAGGPDILHGEAGNDTLTGGADGDELWGGAGADVLVGGDGNDWARYEDSPTGVAVSLGPGTGAGGDAQGDTLTGIEFLWGSAFADTLTGDSGANILRGGGGDDLIRGGAGNDVLDGEGGADVFVFTTGDGIDRIHGFGIGTDLIRIEGAVAGFDDLGISDFNGDAAVAYGFGDVILLTGIDMGAVTAGLFDFV